MMKAMSVLMVIVGVIIGVGALLEFRYFGPETTQFWAGVVGSPAGVLFVVAGILCWRRSRSARRVIVLAGVVMGCATWIATALDVMGPPATLIGSVGAFAALVFGWRHTQRPF